VFIEIFPSILFLFSFPSFCPTSTFIFPGCCPTTEHCSDGWQTGIGENFQRGPLGLIVSQSRNVSTEVGERKKTFCISGVSAGNLSVQILNATAVQAVQNNSSVITWSKVVTCLLHGAESFLRSWMILQLIKKFPAFYGIWNSLPYSQAPAVSCLARILINGNLVQISVKRIRLYIKTKRKIHCNLGHKDHCTHSSHHHTLFVNLPHTLTHPTTRTPLTTQHFYIEPHTLWPLFKRRKLYWK
jgi:hypothetical protein